MSQEIENQSLLANAEADESQDDNSFDAMQQMMGFSSFGGPQKPKRQPRNPGAGQGFGTGANSQPLHSRIASSNTSTSRPRPSSETNSLTGSSHPFIPASLPPRPPKRSSKSPPPPQHIQDASYFQQLLPIQATASPSSATTIVHATGPTQHEEPKIHHGSVSSVSASLIPETFTTNLDEIAYSNPKSGYSMTRRELLAYERGVMEDVMNNDGSMGQVKVYFKPNFIEDNPWEELEIAAGFRERKGGV